MVDIVAANDQASSVSVLVNLGTGAFAPRVDHATDSGPASISLADVQGDGNADLVVANSASSTISVLVGEGTGTFAPKVDYPTGGAVQWSPSMAVATRRR